MITTPLSPDLTRAVERLMRLGEPYVRARTSSDYWLYASLFSSTCPVAIIDDAVAGAIVAFRSQEAPEDVYIQDVMVHPDHRRGGVSRALLASVHQRAAGWGCRRLYLTSEAGNTAAHATWLALGFVKVPGDRIEHGVSVISDYKDDMQWEPPQHSARLMGADTGA